MTKDVVILDQAVQNVVGDVQLRKK